LFTAPVAGCAAALARAAGVGLAQPAAVALPRTSNCPGGYFTSGDYCLNLR
jgi:hypothetical protein